MGEFVVFTLSAPIGSFGDLAGHERRGSDRWPAKSAILGMVGAAQGIRRDDAEGLAELLEWQVAVATLQLGEPFRDFHTIQSVQQSYKTGGTRKLALEQGELDGKVNTSITFRDYYTDCLFVAALWHEEDGCRDKVVEALKKPHFNLYLGRKACALSAPLAPKPVSAESPFAAMREASLPPWAEWPEPEKIPVACDPWQGVHGRIENRWDIPTDRASWHFSQRQLQMLTLSAAAGG